MKIEITDVERIIVYDERESAYEVARGHVYKREEGARYIDFWLSTGYSIRLFLKSAEKTQEKR